MQHSRSGTIHILLTYTPWLTEKGHDVVGPPHKESIWCLLLFMSFLSKEENGITLLKACTINLAVSVCNAKISSVCLLAPEFMYTVWVSTWIVPLFKVSVFELTTTGKMIFQQYNDWGPARPLSSGFFVWWSQVITWRRVDSRCGNNCRSCRERPVVVCSSKLYWAEVINWRVQC